MAPASQITWTWHKLSDLSGVDVHAMLAARSAVFVVEQESIYQDPDPIDAVAWHLLGRGTDGSILAYARVTPPGSRFTEPSIGRVLTMPAARGKGLGREIVAMALQKCRDAYPGRDVRISAQTYLTGFYEGFGFQVAGSPYNEDGIPHVEMLRPAE